MALSLCAWAWDMWVDDNRESKEEMAGIIMIRVLNMIMTLAGGFKDCLLDKGKRGQIGLVPLRVQ